MEKTEILQKIEALKAVLKNADDLIYELHGVVLEKAFASREAMFGCLDKGKDIDKAEYSSVCQENAYYENMVSKLENAAYQLSKGVIENIEKIK